MARMSALLGSLLACATTSSPPAPEAVHVQEMGEAPQETPAPEPVAPSVEPHYGTLTLMTGFVPDPTVAEGRAGGPEDATTRDVSCVGHISHVPTHLLDLRTDFAWLRVMVKSGGDTTLVIRTPDERFLCNDDAEGLNPAIEGAFSAGLYDVWVGTYEAGAEAPHRLGVTELQGVMPSSL